MDTPKNGKITGSITGSKPLTNPLQIQQAKAENSKQTLAELCTSTTLKVYVGRACVQDPNSGTIYCVVFYDIYQIRNCYQMGDEPVGDEDGSGWPDPSSSGGGTVTEELIDQEEEIEVYKDTVLVDKFAKNEKAMCALLKLMQNNFYKNTLNNFIGQSKPIDLMFNLGIIAEDPGFIQYGATDVTPQSWNANLIQVTLNSNRIDNMSSIQVAFTLLHEGIHAEIYRKLLSIHGPSNLNIKNYPSMFNLYQQYTIQQGFSHEYMANYYVNTMASALREYDNNKFDISYYKAYAWQGLDGTDFYDSKSSGEKTAIQAAINTLLDNRSIVGCNDL